jgi:hypothetical protein
MKQERPYIVEWVAWHRLLGFDIIIADNGGNDGQSELLLSLADAGFISYIDARMFTCAPQVLAYYAMFRLARRAGVRYLGFLDADEFFEPLSVRVAPGAGATLVSRLFAQTNAIALAFNWMTFGSSGLTEISPDPVLQRFVGSAPMNFGPNHHFKSFCDVTQIVRILGSGIFSHLMLNPHGPMTEASHYSHDGLPMLFDAQRFGLTQQVLWANARIRHYVVKSRAEYDRKTSRGSAALSHQDYGPTFFNHHDRNDILTPLGDELLAMLVDAMRGVDIKAASAHAGRPRRNSIDTAAMWWHARPPARMLLPRLLKEARQRFNHADERNTFR